MKRVLSSMTSQNHLRLPPTLTVVSSTCQIPERLGSKGGVFHDPPPHGHVADPDSEDFRDLLAHLPDGEALKVEFQGRRNDSAGVPHLNELAVVDKPMGAILAPVQLIALRAAILDGRLPTTVLAFHEGRMGSGHI